MSYDPLKDAMERCQGAAHPADKRERVIVAEARLRELGVRIGAHPIYGRADTDAGGVGGGPGAVGSLVTVATRRCQVGGG